MTLSNNLPHRGVASFLSSWQGYIETLGSCDLYMYPKHVFALTYPREFYLF